MLAQAAALGVAAGPLFGQLKNGQPVPGTDGRLVQPEEVSLHALPHRGGGGGGPTRKLKVELPDCLVGTAGAVGMQWNFMLACGIVGAGDLQQSQVVI